MTSASARSAWLGWVVLGAILLAPALPDAQIAGAALLAQGAADAPEVVEVRFVGADRFPRNALAAAISTRATSCRTPALLPACLLGAARDRRYLNERSLHADLVRLRLFYFQRGYRDAVVDVEIVPEEAPRGPSSEPLAAASGSLGAPPADAWAAERVRVIFRIQEGEPIRVGSLDIEGAEELLPWQVDRELPLQVGAPFSLLAYEESRDSVRALLRNGGYPWAEVLGGYVVPAGSMLADVRFEVVPGERARFGAIEVTGNERVAESVIRRVLTFREGDPYRHSELLSSQQNLFGLSVFRHAEVRAEGVRADGDTLVPVRVLVNEGDTRRVRLGAGLSTADCVNAEGRWVARNFLGGARRLELRGQISNVLAEQMNAFPCIDTGDGIYSQLSGLVGADLAQPWFLGTRNTLRAGIFAERRSVPEVFVRNTQGAYLAIERTLGRSSHIGIGYRPELTRLDVERDLYFCVNFVVCAERDIQVLQERHWLAPISVSFGRDHSDSRFNPTRGHLLLAEAEFGTRAFGSNFSFLRLTGELRAYQELVPGLVAAARLRPGWAYSLKEPGGAGLGLHPQKRFFAGGPNSVRGFAQHRLGPKVLTVDAAGVLARPIEEGGAGCSVEAINSGTCDPNPVTSGFEVRPVGGAGILEGSFELRFPITTERLHGAAFLDFGQVWSEGASLRIQELAWTPGAGLRYMSPIGPIRVDLGYNTRGGELLTVITTEVEVTEEGIVNTAALRHLEPAYHWRPRDSVLDRLQLHFSIGQAF